MVADVRCVVTGAAGSLERRDAAGDQASGCYIIVDAGDAGDGNLQSVEELLATRHGAPGGGMFTIVLDLRPTVIEVEDVGSKLDIARLHQPTRLLESGKQKVDAGVDTDEEWLGGERDRPAVRARFVQSASVAVSYLSGKEFRFEVYDLLLFLEGWPRPVPLSVDIGSVHRLVRQVV